MAEVAGNVGPFGAVGRGLQGLSTAARTGAMMGLAGGLSAGEVRGNIFEKISSTPDAELQAASPEYARLRQTMGEAEAKATIGGDFERNAPEILAAGAVGALGESTVSKGWRHGSHPRAAASQTPQSVCSTRAPRARPSSSPRTSAFAARCPIRPCSKTWR